MMEIYRSLEAIEPVQNSSITVGTFDGVHAAHTQIINSVIRSAKANGQASSVVTFDPHPRLIVHKDQTRVDLLTSVEEKIERISKFEVDRLVIIPFTKEFSKLTPEHFVTKILCNKIGLKKLIIGYDHGFGKNREGSIEYLQKIGLQCGFEVEIQSRIANDLGVISSTQIRNFLLDGDVEKASISLGRDYQLIGVVVKGDGRGKSLSFPTANIQPEFEYKCIPAIGVYNVKVEVDDTLLQGVMNIGMRPTFDKNKLSLEVHIPGFEGDLYRKRVTISFVSRIRGEKRFENIDALKVQIQKDILSAQNYKKQTNSNNI